MKEFMKVLGFAVVATALMLSIAVLSAGVLRSCNREIVYCVLISIATISMVFPLFVMESKKEWVTNFVIFCMAYFPMQALLIAALL